MSDSPELDCLAELLGLEPAYHDIWGKLHVGTAAAKRELIAAMGVPAAGDDEVRRSLDALRQQQRTRLSPPVATFLVGEPISVALGEQAAALHWTVVEEGGARHAGHATFLPDQPADTRRLQLPPLPQGYHRLSLGMPGHEPSETVLIIAPPACFSADAALGAGGRAWGLAIQLYGLRSADNWGMGDFGDLIGLVEAAAALGCDAIGLNPLHAAFPADPNHFGPYGPSNRNFLNILYISLPQVPEYADSEAVRRWVEEPEFQDRLAATRKAELVDYPAVSALKMPLLEVLYREFRDSHLAADSARAQRFRAFQHSGGEALRRHTLFEALHEYFFKERGAWFWPDWPEDYRHPQAAGAERFAAEQSDRLEFFAYLQFLAQEQLDAAGERARQLGLRLGLYRDLAVANHPGGAAAWANPDVVLRGASIGAPPDALGPQGQNWGLSPLSPHGLSETAYAHFIDGLRANMRGSGAIRIDHVMALLHLFWIPGGKSAADGMYVAYPFEDMMRVLALESQRHHCLVVGEDLGTVPEGFRPALRRNAVLSTRVLYFERGGDRGFIAPEHYESEAQVNATTHDLPTLRGFWAGTDIRWRDRIGLYPDPRQRDHDIEERGRDRARLLASLRYNGALPSDSAITVDDDAASDELVVAVHRYLSRTPGRLLMVQMEDLMGEIEQPNLPGTVDEHPNWRRKLSLPLEKFAAHPRVQAIAEAVRAERRR
jgi:4-alpha-glucanotransferase